MGVLTAGKRTRANRAISRQSADPFGIRWSSKCEKLVENLHLHFIANVAGEYAAVCRMLRAMREKLICSLAPLFTRPSGPANSN